MRMRTHDVPPSRLRAALLAFTLTGSLSATAQAQVPPDWTAATAGSSGVALAVDGRHHSITTSNLPGGPITLTRRSPDGVTVWQRSLATAGAVSRATGLVADAAGNLTVTGYLADAVGTPLGALVARLDSAGNLLWQDVQPAAQGFAWRAVLDGSGNAYVLSQQPRAGSTPVSTEPVLTRYSAAGVRQWTRTVGAGYLASDTPLLVTPGGLVVATASGSVSGQELLAAWDAAGNAVWSKAVASSGPLGLALGRSGELYAVGRGGLGFLVIKHDAAFTELWRNSYAASGGALRAAVDGAGNLLVSGVTNAQTGMLTVISNDWLTLKLDAGGNLLWQHQLGTTPNGDDAPAALAVAADGTAYLAGRGTLAVAGTGGTFNQRSTVTLKLGSDGAARWLANTTSTLRGTALQLAGDGGVLVLGDSTQLAVGDGGHAVLRYPQSGLPNQAPVAAATASPATGPAPLAVAFSAAGASDPDGAIASWRWDFGDGQSSTSTTSGMANHVYAAIGSYTARLTVTDTLGLAATSAPLAVSATALAPARPTAVALASTSVLGGSLVNGTVRLSSSAGVTLRLASSNSAVASVPASVVVPAGASQAGFVVTTGKVRKNTSVTVRATANGVTTSAVLTVRAR